MRGDPYFLKARFKSVCPDTGKVIENGDECCYFQKARKAYHKDSEAANGAREMKFAEAYGMGDANW